MSVHFLPDSLSIKEFGAQRNAALIPRMYPAAPMMNGDIRADFISLLLSESASVNNMTATPIPARAPTSAQVHEEIVKTVEYECCTDLFWFI